MRIRVTNTPDKQRGFTLPELLITIAIVAILTTIALPNLREFVLSNRLSTDVNGFVGLVNYARSEAIVRNQDVVICPKTNGNSITCVNDQFWGQYDIQAFVDINGNGQRNVADILLKTIPATDPGGTVRRITRSAGVGTIKFGAAGFAQTAHRFDIHAVGDAEFELTFGRSVCISRPGRARVTTNGGACN